MKKIDTKLLEKECAERLKTVRAFDVVGKPSKPKPEVLSFEEFAARGYTFGTPAQAWRALRQMAAEMATGEAVSPETALWFVNAINEQGEDHSIHALTKNLGLYEHGRTRIFNKFDICNRMAELVERDGLSKAEAARRCATQFGCNMETARMWYRRKDELYPEK